MNIKLKVYEHSDQVLAVFFVCTVLVRIICSKMKHFDEAIVDKDIINKVGYKIQELELKINILTYKVQYGSWPLPHQVCKSSFKKKLRNLRLTMSNPNDRNEWIKHVLLSPRRNESCLKYSYPSKQHLSELFAAKKNTFYPYLRRDNLMLDHSSKSSKSNSDKSLRLNSAFRKTIGRKQHKILKSEHSELQSRNAISLPFFSRRKNSKSTSKINRDSKFFKDEKTTSSCTKFTKTMDDCKWYLKELRDSNKHLGLVCSSSEISDESSFKDVWSEMQESSDQHNQSADLKTNEKSTENAPSEPANKVNLNEEMNVERSDSKQQIKENSSQLSNAICPILKADDKSLLPPKMNITFYSEMFPRQSVSNVLIPSPCERKKFVQSSQEALYQVKRKLESLHNVLRMYEIRNSEARVMERQHESNNKINNICQNVVDTLVSVTTNNCNEKKKSKVSFDTDIEKDSDGIQRIACNSSDQYESDETCTRSEESIQNYPNTFSTHCSNNVSELHCALLKKTENKIYPLNNKKLNIVNDNKAICSSTITYNKIPERAYYTISSDLVKDKNTNRDLTLSNVYTENNRATLFSHRQTVPMETDEDLLIMSPTSSHTEISKDSESDDKSTALLLQEALQFKEALLTRVELEKICYANDKNESANNESPQEYSKCSYINNNLQSKFLDIISEEQSVSSSTDKTSQTYMFLNIKPDKQLIHSSMFNNNIVDYTQKSDIKDKNMHKGYLNSKHNLESTSEYFSLSNIIPEKSTINSEQLPLSKHTGLQENNSTKMSQNNLEMKYLNHAIDNKCNKKHVGIRFSNYLKDIDVNMNEHNICYNYINDKENFGKSFLDLNNVNEFVDPNSESVELFSQNLDEENQNANTNDNSNFLNSTTLNQCTNTLYMKKIENNSSNTKLNLLNDKKCTKESEILMHSPNLTLRRHPGTCSLIEQPLITNIEERTDMDIIIGNADTMYELSLSESKENSIEMNLIQDSITSSINQSNDSNIPEPPSVTVLINKPGDEDFNLNWSNIKDNFSDNCVNEKHTQTFSADTITLRNYDSIDTETYCRQETTCNENITFIEEYKTTNTLCNQDDKLKGGKNNSVVENLFTNIDNEDSINEAVCKSYSNLISPHSSLYFTDEASSSTAKLNNVQSTNFENYLQPNAYTEKGNEHSHYKNECSKEPELFSTSMSDENKTNNQFTTKQELMNFNKGINSRNDLSSKYFIAETDISSMIKIKEAPKKENKTSSYETLYINNDINNLLPLKDIINKDQTRSNLLMTKAAESLNADQNISNILSQQISPRGSKDDTLIKKISTTVKSKSQENYVAKSEKLKKSITAQDANGLKSDLFNRIQAKAESSTTSTHTRIRDLSVEPRRNTERVIELDKKRSRSQISFRTNESSRQITSQSFEYSNNKNNQLPESKLKLKSHIKSLLPMPKTSSKSCIPILKSRLEAARRSENEGRSKSPVRGPLTMTMFWRDNLSNKSHNIMDESIKVEGKSENNDQCMEEINSCLKKEDDHNHSTKHDSMKPSCIIQSLSEKTANTPSQEPMVIYVNIFTKYDHNTTKIVNPKKFLEYIKNRKLNVQKVIEENQLNQKDEDVSVEKEKNTMHKIVTIVSSVTNGNELDQTISTDLSTSKAHSKSTINTLSSDKLKHLYFLSVEQREIDVTAKPSVIDTSTSISDLGNISETSKNTLSKFQICGTPKELNSDEYIALLEILHQESNFAHLQELQNVCKKLVIGHPKVH